MIATLVLLTGCLIVSTHGQNGCECNGQRNSRGGPPCSTRYGEGLDGNPEYNRWCYVDRSNRNCNSRPSQAQRGLYWSYDGCYEFQELSCEGICTAEAGGYKLRRRYGGGGSGSFTRG